MKASQFFKRYKKVLYLLVGLGTLVYLFVQTPFQELVESLKNAGPKALLTFLVAPLWFALNALSFAFLMNFKVPWVHLFYNHLVGEGLNNLIPLAGLAGEPFKAKHLSKWMPLSQATQFVVRDKLLIAQSGMIFIALVGVGVLLSKTLPPALFATTTVIVVILLALALSIVYVLFSQRPSKAIASLLIKWKLLEDFKSQKISTGNYLMALILKIFGRALQLVECWAIFWALGIDPSSDGLLLVTFFVMASGLIFFAIPQGIGVNELGVSGAFRILGLSQPLALSFGFIRRARMLALAFFGVLLLFLTRSEKDKHTPN